ncbi:endolytic transglycosylase MltG, partial [Microbacterium sp. AGC62]
EWNTYKRQGLPATPISSASDAAIDAAMHPADGPWLYFVTINLETGETQFSETMSEHEQGIEKWRAWCRENPDAGC